MKIKSYFLIIAVIILTFTESCKDYGTHGSYTVSGTIEFVHMDTTLISANGGYFAVALFPNETNALYFKEPSFEEINPTLSGDEYKAAYSINMDFSPHYVAVIWIKKPYNVYDQKPVLGTFGCDTSSSCQDFSLATGSNNPVNFYSYGDTAYRVFYNTPH